MELPPRDRLPPGVTIEKLPILGTSWYQRGPGYWVRRFWLFLLMALVVTLTSLLVGGFLVGIKDGSHTGFVVAAIIEAARERLPRLRLRAGTGLLLAQVVLVLGSLLFFGLYVMLLVYALLPEYPQEHKARLRLARALA